MDSIWASFGGGVSFTGLSSLTGRLQSGCVLSSNGNSLVNTQPASAARAFSSPSVPGGAVREGVLVEEVVGRASRHRAGGACQGEDSRSPAQGHSGCKRQQKPRQHRALCEGCAPAVRPVQRLHCPFKLKQPVSGTLSPLERPLSVQALPSPLCLHFSSAH